MLRLPIPRSTIAALCVAAAAASAGVFAATPLSETAETAAVDLARGCWIRRAPGQVDGRDTALLRLLPDPERPSWLRGDIAWIGDDPNQRLRLWLARDGRRALLAAASVLDPEGPAARVGAPAGPIPMWTPPEAIHPEPVLDHAQLTRVVLDGSDRVAFVRSQRKITAIGGAAGRSAEIEYRAEASPLRLRVKAAEERMSLTVSGAVPGSGSPLSLFAGTRDGCD